MSARIYLNDFRGAKLSGELVESKIKDNYIEIRVSAICKSEVFMKTRAYVYRLYISANYKEERQETVCKSFIDGIIEDGEPSVAFNYDLLYKDTVDNVNVDIAKALFKVDNAMSSEDLHEILTNTQYASDTNMNEIILVK